MALPMVCTKLSARRTRYPLLDLSGGSSFDGATRLLRVPMEEAYITGTADARPDFPTTPGAFHGHLPELLQYAIA